MALCMKPEFQRTLDKQRRKIVKLGDEVLKREEDVIALRKKHVTHSYKTKSQHRLGTWRDQFTHKDAIDKGFRPPDRKNSSRNYTRMDDDLWDKMDLRGWFDKYYRPRPLEHNDLERQKYLVPNMGGSVRERVQPGPPTPLPRRPTPFPTEPHWANYEGNLRHQETKSAMLGRGVRAAQGPWKDRPIDVEREGYDAYVPLHRHKQQRDAMLAEATLHAHEHNREVKDRVQQQRAGSGIFDAPPARSSQGLTAV